MLLIVRPKEKRHLVRELASHGTVSTEIGESIFRIRRKEPDTELGYCFADCIWSNVRELGFESITDAQRLLRAISRKWQYYGDRLYRRGALIAEPLEIKHSKNPLHFPNKPADFTLKTHAFTLASENTLYWSDTFSKPTVDGMLEFTESKYPPSRAYLKLWEALYILGDYPKPGEQTIDLGSSPGSWTWVIASLGARVQSVDRATLNERVAKLPGVAFESADAFKIPVRKIDWLFSDLICYPEKLYEFVVPWLTQGACQKFICTLKFKGEPDFDIIRRFQSLPHSSVIHLNHNKNEATWICHPQLNSKQI